MHGFKLLLTRIDKALQTIKSFWLLKVLIKYQVIVSAEQRYVLSTNLSTVVDIGANRGQFTLAVRRWAYNANVISFEPLEIAANQFRNIFRGDPKVTFHQIAIGPKKGIANLHVSAADDSSSLLPISSLQERLFPGTHELRIEQVEIAPLSVFIKPEKISAPAMLKIDVQGYELETLNGCKSLLHIFSFIYVECSFVELYKGQVLANEIISWISNNNFHLIGIYNIIYDGQGKCIQADFLFQNNNLLNSL